MENLIKKQKDASEYGTIASEYGTIASEYGTL